MEIERERERVRGGGCRRWRIAREKIQKQRKMAKRRGRKRKTGEKDKRIRKRKEACEKNT